MVTGKDVVLIVNTQGCIRTKTTNLAQGSAREYSDVSESATSTYKMYKHWENNHKQKKRSENVVATSETEVWQEAAAPWREEPEPANKKETEELSLNCNYCTHWVGQLSSLLFWLVSSVRFRSLGRVLKRHRLKTREQTTTFLMVKVFFFNYYFILKKGQSSRSKQSTSRVSDTLILVLIIVWILYDTFLLYFQMREIEIIQKK